MQLTDLQTALKRYGFSDDDPLTTWINAALHQIETAFEWSWLEKQVSGTLTATSFMLSLPNDFQKMKSFLIADPSTGSFSKLMWMDRTQFDRKFSEDASAQGRPLWYSPSVPQAGVPVVSIYPSADVSYTYSFIYRANVVELVNPTDTPGIPTYLHYSIVHGAAYIALQAENEEERSNVARNEFIDGINRAWERDARPTNDQPNTVVDVMGYMDDR